MTPRLHRYVRDDFLGRINVADTASPEPIDQIRATTEFPLERNTITDSQRPVTDVVV
ncbi:MAG: hypothetical protein WBN24_05350 [Acidimicrobiia bacterium]